MLIPGISTITELDVLDAICQKSALALDTLPSGFPRTESGVEIELLKICMRWRRQSSSVIFETADKIGRRTC